MIILVDCSSIKADCGGDCGNDGGEGEKVVLVVVMLMVRSFVFQDGTLFFMDRSKRFTDFGETIVSVHASSFA